MRKKNQITQIDILKKYYCKHPDKEIPHNEIVDWVTKEWKKRTGTVFRDPDRGIRTLYERGFLTKIKTGVYRYNPKNISEKKSKNFTKTQKEQILKRDSYKCILCGQGKKEGLTLHVDHIKPKYLGGQATLQNGQTLCSSHNMFKKNLKQTEIGKKMFVRLYDLSKRKNDHKLRKFCLDILKIYKQHSIDEHIKWKK